MLRSVFICHEHYEARTCNLARLYNLSDVLERVYSTWLSLATLICILIFDRRANRQVSTSACRPQLASTRHYHSWRTKGWVHLCQSTDAVRSISDRRYTRSPHSTQSRRCSLRASLLATTGWPVLGMTCSSLLLSSLHQATLTTTLHATTMSRVCF